MKKVFMYTFLIVFIISLLTCCGSKGDTVEGYKNNQTDSVHKPTKDSRISFFTLKTESRDFFERLFRDFKTESGITVEQDYNANSYTSVLSTRIAANEMPDLFSVFPGNTDSVGICALAPKGYLLDITNEPFINEYQDIVNDQMRISGKQYSISCDIQVVAVLYNKKLFRQAGISNTPKNIDEWWDVCAKLKNANIDPMSSSHTWFLETIGIAPSVVFSQDRNWQKKRDKGEVRYNSQPWINVFNILSTMQKKGYFIDNLLTRTYADSINIFATSQTGMVLMGSWEYENIKRIAGLDFELGAFFFPGNKSGEELIYPSTIGDMFAIASETKYPKECKVLLEYFTKKNIDMQRAFGGLSTLKDNSNQSVSTLIKELLPEILNSESYTFANNEWPQAFYINYQDLMAEEKTIEEMLEEADKLFDDLSKKQNE